MNKIVKLTNALLVLLLMMAETPVLAQKSSLSQSSVSQPSVKPSRIWSELATGYTSAQMIKVEKVLFYSDRTEIGMHIDNSPGGRIEIAPETYLQAADKQYKVKSATMLKLGEPFTIPEDGQVDFALTFDALPDSVNTISIRQPNGWTIFNIHSTDYTPSGLENTYWRDQASGEWCIGFTSHSVIYDQKAWAIDRRTDKKDRYEFLLIDPSSQQKKMVQVDKLKKGLRTITVKGERTMTCSPITTAFLPDYPMKDTRKGFLNTGYQEGDSVTITGWLKDMPEMAWRRGKNFEVRFTNIFTDEEENAYAKMDSLGRFSLKIPMLNSYQVFMDWGRTTVSTVLEPGESYYFLHDFHSGQKLFMGKNSRVQNELLSFPYAWNTISADGRTDAMTYLTQMDSVRKSNVKQLQTTLIAHPNLSERFVEYTAGFYQVLQAMYMMQAKFAYKGQLPLSYMEYVGNELWKSFPQPVTLYSLFSTFSRDYIDQLTSGRANNNSLKSVLLRLDRKKVISLKEDDRNLLNQYEKSTSELRGNIQKAKDNEERQGLVKAFNEGKLVSDIGKLAGKYMSFIVKEVSLATQEQLTSVCDSIGCNPSLRSILLARHFTRSIDRSRQPLDSVSLAFVEKEIQLPAALHSVNNLNYKYLSLQKGDLEGAASLRPSSDVEGMSDGEKIFRKILEPYQGRLVYLDVWGTWCSPCKKALSESHVLKEALKDFDIVYLYLANRSDDKSWKNVIKEYQLTGDHCIHYNLPADQQSAIEHYLNIHSFPTYKLIDKKGNIHDLDWRHADNMNRFKQQVEQLSK